MNCLLVDDDLMSRSTLAHFIGRVDYLNVKGECSSAVEALKILEKEKIDLMFLDIEMPEMNGIEMVKNMQIKPLVILTTSHKEYALDAFEHNVIDYLVKPIEFPRFLKAVTKAKELFDARTPAGTSETDCFFVKRNSVLNKVYVKDILWVEALGDYVTINTADNKFILHLTLKAIERKLPVEKFARVHRSYIVNVENISSVEDDTITIRNNHIPVGAMYKENFMKRLNLL